MKKKSYLHTDIPGITTKFETNNPVVISSFSDVQSFDSLKIVINGTRLAIHLGIKKPSEASLGALPYAEDNDRLTYDGPLSSLATGRRIGYLRGWKNYDGCVKGFNAIGLLTEHALKELRKLQQAGGQARKAAKLDFLCSRSCWSEKNQRFEAVFSKGEIEQLTEEALNEVDEFDVALWKAFAKRPIFCSTSSNMGISLHQVLRNMQVPRFELNKKKYSILNRNEGWLVIWCPDERADFMDPEKTETLRSLETELPPLTSLRTYINRKERDPGALREALINGGYFFPTNPQSEEEMQNLLFIALYTISAERNQTIVKVLEDPNILRALTSLDCEVSGTKISVTSGVVGGLHGLMIPYLIMLEETLEKETPKAVEVWNQASIGAGLAALVLADMRLRKYGRMPKAIKEDMKELFPKLSALLEADALDRQIRTCIHGVFDVANLQSLAQLLGVVVERHLSGRKTAIVGLGSSSYATGNRCYDILKHSVDSNGPFSGRKTFHPATHALVPIAQALIYADDLYRILNNPGFDSLSDDDRIALVKRHAVKAERAGAASMAGYLLARLDMGTISIMEIILVLKTVGFDSQIFLEFAGLGKEPGAVNRFLQWAHEEGEYMGQLAKNFLTILDWSLDDLRAFASSERIYSRLNYCLRPLDEVGFDILNPIIYINLTGDNTIQPSCEWIKQVLPRCLANRDVIKTMIDEEIKWRSREQTFDRIAFVNVLFERITKTLERLKTRLDHKRKKTLNRMIEKRAKSLQKRVLAQENKRIHEQIDNDQ